VQLRTPAPGSFFFDGLVAKDRRVRPIVVLLD